MCVLYLKLVTGLPSVCVCGGALEREREREREMDRYVLSKSLMMVSWRCPAAVAAESTSTRSLSLSLSLSPFSKLIDILFPPLSMFIKEGLSPPSH